LTDHAVVVAPETTFRSRLRFEFIASSNAVAFQRQDAKAQRRKEETVRC